MKTPGQYVWLVWASLFFASWLILWSALPRCRQAMWWSSLISLPFAFSELLFVGRYWLPPSVFHLAQRIHLDVESFIFCFAIGGIDAVLFNLVMRKPVRAVEKRYEDRRSQIWSELVLATPGPVFLGVLFATGRPMWAGVSAMAAGAAARMIRIPELAPKTCAGGLLFLFYYIILFGGLQAFAPPGYVDRVWQTGVTLGQTPWGMPTTELLFALCFGLYWSGLYEQIFWTLHWPIHVESQNISQRRRARKERAGEDEGG